MRKLQRRQIAGGVAAGALLLLVLGAGGCGTTRTSDTTRTATEQLLISHAIDATVSRLDFRIMAGKRVYLDPQYLNSVTDKEYLISSLRQHLLACGCLLQEERTKATYVIEARAGSVGTDRNDMLIGVPQMSFPAVMPGIPGTMIPEIALAKKSNRRAVVKIAVFAYDRVSGEPISQSGIVEAISREQNSWLCGAGPFQRGSLHRGTDFDNQSIVVPILDRPGGEANLAAVTEPAVWKSGPLPEEDEAAASKPAQRQKNPAGATELIQASSPSSPAAAAEKSE
ncbi:MAG: DUF6655 family protein [Gemmataceae bacterium]